MHTLFYFFNLALISAEALYACFILTHLISWLLIKKEKPAINPPAIKVSVIIPVRNEEKTISACLKCLQEQDYPANLTEVIICDDYSDDNTKETVMKLIGSHTNFRYLPPGLNQPGKKAAIEAGIKASSGELIIQTDADCTFGKKWITYMVNSYHDTKPVMLCGPVAIKDESNFCEKFQALELCGLSLLSGAGINLGAPLLSNAANIAYTRHAFDSVGGFNGISHTPTGDDILLMFKLNKKFPGTVKYVKNPDATVYTAAQPTWKDLFSQRIRWASKGLRANNALNSIVSLLVFFANFLLIIGLTCLVIYPYFMSLVAVSLILKALVDFLLLSFAVNFFKKGNLILYYPLSLIVVMVYTSFVGIVCNLVGFSWKGRNY